MSITCHARPLAVRWPGLAVWLAARREHRLRREAQHELAELPPYLLRDIGLVDLARAREANGGRTLDHTQPQDTALFNWTW